VAAAAAGGAQVAGRPLKCVTSFGKPNAEPFRLAAASLAAQARRLAGGAAAPASHASPAHFSAIYHGARLPSPAAAHSSAQPPAPVLRPGFAMHTSAVMSPNRSCEKWGASVGCDVVCLVQKFASAGRRRMRSAARCSAAH